MGSTKFKQTVAGWQHIFLSFYREFPQFVERVNRGRGDDLQTDFVLWKAVGDELIFEVEVKNEQEVSRAVRVWLDAVSAYEREVLDDKNLSLKGGAFIATFPGPDSRSTIPRTPDVETSDESPGVLNDRALTGPKQHRKYLYDYFGPSIDTGFRVFGLASMRHFTLSIEVAWAIALAAHHAIAEEKDEETHQTVDIVSLGAHVLKGVWNQREYPVFAIDRHHADPVNQAMSKIAGAPMDPMMIIDVCRACAADEHWPFSMYLPSSSNPAFSNVPEDAMADLLGAQTTLEGGETTPTEDDDTGLAGEAVDLGD